MRFHEILSETYVNVFSDEDKAAHAPRVLELITTAYSKIGGNPNYRVPEDLLTDPGMWKLVRRNGEIIFASIFKDVSGRKRVAIGHDGSPEAKQEFYKMLVEDIHQHRAWGEASGATARVMIRAGIPVVPSQWAEELTGKEILAYGDDGYTYTRIIAGKRMTKVILGYPNGRNIGDIPDESQANQILQATAI